MIAIASCGHFPDDERVYHKQIKTLLTAGHTIRYYSYSARPTLHNKKKKSLNVYTFNSRAISQKKYKSILLKELNENPPEIFHIHDLELLSVAYKLKRRHKKTKIIYDVHEDLVSMWSTLSSYPNPIKYFINSALSKYEKYYLSCVDQFIIANRLANKKRYSKYGPVLVLENFPLKKNIQEIKKQKRIYKIVYHGQISKERGILTLIKAFNLLYKKNDKIELTLIGSVRTKLLKEKINHLICKNKKIKLINQVPHDQIWSYLNKSHIGVIPFNDAPLFQHNTPTKLFEYMATNCSIVSSDFKPISEFAKDTIRLINPSNEFELASNINHYIKDIVLYNFDTMKNNELVQTQYHWECISIKLINIYKSLKK